MTVLIYQEVLLLELIVGTETILLVFSISKVALTKFSMGFRIKKKDFTILYLIIIAFI